MKLKDGNGMIFEPEGARKYKLPDYEKIPESYGKFYGIEKVLGSIKNWAKERALKKEANEIMRKVPNITIEEIPGITVSDGYRKDLFGKACIESFAYAGNKPYINGMTLAFDSYFHKIMGHKEHFRKIYESCDMLQFVFDIEERKEIEVTILCFPPYDPRRNSLKNKGN